MLHFAESFLKHSKMQKTHTQTNSQIDEKNNKDDAAVAQNAVEQPQSSQITQQLLMEKPSDEQEVENVLFPNAIV